MSSDREQWISDEMWLAAERCRYSTQRAVAILAESLVVAEANLIVALESYRAATEADDVG